MITASAHPQCLSRVWLSFALRCVAFNLRSFSSCLHLEAASFSLCFEPSFSCFPFLSSDSILSMHLLDTRTDCPHAMLASNDHVLRRCYSRIDFSTLVCTAVIGLLAFPHQFGSISSVRGPLVCSHLVLSAPFYSPLPLAPINCKQVSYCVIFV